jgi:coatomer protein complex subunit gamma
MLELLDGWLRHKSDMVNFEAARAICEMKNVTAAQLTKPISGKYIVFYLTYRMLIVCDASPSALPVLAQTRP